MVEIIVFKRKKEDYMVKKKDYMVNKKDYMV